MSFEKWKTLTAQDGISSRPEALAKGAANRARATTEYFIFFLFFGFEGLWYAVVVLNFRSDILQFNTIFNESVGRSKLTEVKLEEVSEETVALHSF